MKKVANKKHKWPESKTFDEKRGNPKMQGAQIKDPREKKRQLQNARGSNQIPPIKKEATSKHKGLESKTSDEERGNPKMQGAQIKDLLWKKRQPKNARGSNQRPPMKKEAIPKRKGLKQKTSDANRGN
jgi:hypothetical protein